MLLQIPLIGSIPGESEDIRLKKSLLVVCSFPFLLVGALWGIMYMEFGEALAGLIPLLIQIGERNSKAFKIGKEKVKFFSLLNLSKFIL